VLPVVSLGHLEINVLHIWSINKTLLMSVRNEYGELPDRHSEPACQRAT
jgi:hypothetical protein